MKTCGLFAFAFLVLAFSSLAQRSYTTESVLAKGNWYKISVPAEGVYKIDVAFLSSLGLNTQSISSASIRLYGNGGGMLPESNAVRRYDDLQENAIMIMDGGDGLFNGSDYLLFYSQGPHTWNKDSLNKTFTYQTNLYSSEFYYYLTIGGPGKRISTGNALSSNFQVTSFDERIAHEIESVNFLRSGKQWYGEEFGHTPGSTLNRAFSFHLPALVNGSDLRLNTSVAARSVGAPANFDIRLNGQSNTVAIAAVSGNYLEAFAVEATTSLTSIATQDNVTVNYTFIPAAFNAQGWLNWFTLSGRRRLNMQGLSQQSFRDWQSMAAGNIAEFRLENVLPNAQVWDVTDPLNPVRMFLQGSGSAASFSNHASSLREYIYIDGVFFPSPQRIGTVANQNLHAPVVVDYLIISPAAFRSEANRLAAFHRQRNALKCVVTTTEEIFNELSSGVADPAAIRDYVKMYYDRAGNDSTLRPKYLLLFGDASFDYKARVTNNTNLVPAFESTNSLDPLGTYTTDDFFALLDDADDINLTSPPALLDLGVGRIPASTVAEAKNSVDKLVHYHSPAALGSWRNQLTLVADDEDANLHLNDAELFSTTSSANPVINQNKIYLDAYRQESGSGGSRYPEVNKAIANQMTAGNLVWNYTGHGGSSRLAEEAVLDQEILRLVENKNKLPLMITATCDFAPYDDPANKSIGEQLLLANDKGAIALTTTTRLVFAFSNRVINNNFLSFALTPDSLGSHLRLGDIMRRTKNHTYNASGDVINNRKFTLLGDPAMKLAFPAGRIAITRINGQTLPSADTISALEKVTIDGVITGVNGSTLTGFNGTVYTTIFDKPQPVSTLANDAGSIKTTFQQQTNQVFKGKASVVNGAFTFSFIVPKDINYQVGDGRVSLYAENGTSDATGVFNQLKIGGSGNVALTDNEGPLIKPYLNDEKFVQGGLVNEQPVLLVKLADSSGINTSGTGIGHDLTAILDNDDKNVLVLNEFYEADLDDYTKGTVRYPLPTLEPGNHTLKVKAWDVANNSSETVLDFVVAKKEALQLTRVLNYPNPFTTHTSFWFEHNQPPGSLKVLIQIFSVSGKLVHQIQKVVDADGNRVTGIDWDGTDSYGQKLARGVYIYKIRVTGGDGNHAEKMEKIYIL